jgi:hypothetical protein
VTDRFGDKEDFGYSEGDEIISNTGNYYSETMWGENSTRHDSDNINAHITELLDWLEPRKSEFHKLAAKANVCKKGSEPKCWSKGLLTSQTFRL